MPIGIDDFDATPGPALDIQEGTQPHQVLSFLAANDEQAFTQSELAEATGISRGSVGAVLSRLEDRSLVRHKGRYWAIGEDDRLAALAAQEGSSSDAVTDDYYGDE
jgi:DNA-binding IclR family transcriptional regulator